MTRRKFLALLAAGNVAPLGARAEPATRQKLLLRSSWNTNNIGDIAHTPGMVALLEKHLPDAQVTMVPMNINSEVEVMLRNRFPKLEIDRSGKSAMDTSRSFDFLLHGSGPGLLAGDYCRKAAERGIPYGIAGVTLDDGEIKTARDILDRARFVYTRDTESLAALKAGGCTCSRTGFGPDATFALDLRNEAAAAKTMAQHSLEPGKYLCAVPRLRWTPKWKDPTEPWAVRKIEENRASAEKDHAKVREAIVAWVRETKMRVLLAPEMTYAVPLLRPLLFDPLPDDVKPYVASLDRYWLTDEAASVYANAAAMVSIEQHSPIIAIANGTPAILLCQPIPAVHRKGQMWRDLGMQNWYFDIDDSTGAQVANRLLEIARDLPAAKAASQTARALAHSRMAEMMAQI